MWCEMKAEGDLPVWGKLKTMELQNSLVCNKNAEKWYLFSSVILCEPFGKLYHTALKQLTQTCYFFIILFKEMIPFYRNFISAAF